jgi:hypothetical protein
MMNYDSERVFTFCLHDLQDLISSKQIDFYDVVSQLQRSIPNKDKYLELASASLSALVAEERYFKNAQDGK